MNPDHDPATLAPTATWRRALEWAVPLLAVAAVVVLPLLVWDRLPDPMASHWGVSGQPDQAMARLLEYVLIAAVTAVLALGPLVAARVSMPRTSARVLVAVAWGVSVVFVLLRVATLQANLDAATWEAAAPLSFALLLALLGACVLAGLAGAWVSCDRPDVRRVTAVPQDVEVAPGEAVVWVGGATGRVALVVPVVLLVASALGALFAGPARLALLVALPLLAVLVSLLGQTRVTVGPRGLRVGLGWFGWPRLGVPIAEVADVAVEDVAPAVYGGWGVRMIPGTTAVVVRQGEAVRVERHRGRAFVVTVDDAAAAAGVLLAHARSRA